MYYVKHKYIDKINIGGIIFFAGLLHDHQTAKFSGYSITHMQAHTEPVLYECWYYECTIKHMQCTQENRVFASMRAGGSREVEDDDDEEEEVEIIAKVSDVTDHNTSR